MNSFQASGSVFPSRRPANKKKVTAKNGAAKNWSAIIFLKTVFAFFCGKTWKVKTAVSGYILEKSEKI